MAVLVTGGSGFIGAGLVRALVEQGRRVVVFDRVAPEGLYADLGDAVSMVSGDLSLFSEVLNAVRDNEIDSIIHMGAMLSLPSDANPWAAYEVNANGTRNVLEAARLFNVPKVAFLSSNAVYGGSKGDIDEGTVQRPGSMYGITKLFGEHLGRFYHRKFGLDFRALRYCVIIGLGAKTKHMAQYMAWMIERSLEGKPFKVWVTEDTYNPWLYHKDAVRALIELHDAPAESIKTRVYNLSGIRCTARELVDKVREHIPSARLSFEPDPEAVALLGKGYGAIDETAARTEWGWRAAYDVDAMLEDMKKDYAAARGAT